VESGEESGLHVGIKELRDGLSRYLDRVREGGTITVTDHGRPIARIRPVGRLTNLEQMKLEGRITPARVPKGTTPLPEPVQTSDGESLMEFIDEQRR
jgi:prevent-host-death family protein